MTQISEILADLRRCLAQVTDSPGLDSEVLIAHVLNKPRAWVLAHPEIYLTLEQEAQCHFESERLKQGIPLPYVIGHWEFFGLEFKITPEVLIPRPETELLVENALEWLRTHPNRRLALDIGTGSGCIAVALASRIHDLFIVATDISFPAVKTAEYNATMMGVLQRVQCVRADLFPSNESHFDLICANLPYIPTATLHGLPVYGKEPEIALDGGFDGLVLIRRMLNSAPGWISPGGLILLEIESTQGQSATTLAATIFPKADIQIIPDLAGLDRLLRIQTV